MLQNTYVFENENSKITVNIETGNLSNLVDLLEFARLHAVGNPDGYQSHFQILESESRKYPIEDINKMSDGWLKTAALLDHCIEHMCHRLLITDNGKANYENNHELKDRYGYRVTSVQEDSFGWLAAKIQYIGNPLNFSNQVFDPFYYVFG